MSEILSTIYRAAREHKTLIEMHEQKMKEMVGRVWGNIPIPDEQ